VGDISGKQMEQHKPHQKWSDEKKAECAMAVLTYGSIEKAAKQCHISPKTLGHWSRHDDRFNEVLENLQGEKALEHKQAYAKIVTKALKEAERGIDELAGDKLKAGDIKALVVTGATATDKGLLLDGKPTSIRGESTSAQSKIDYFEKIERDYQLRKANSIQGECEEIEPND